MNHVFILQTGLPQKSNITNNQMIEEYKFYKLTLHDNIIKLI